MVSKKLSERRMQRLELDFNITCGILRVWVIGPII